MVAQETLAVPPLSVSVRSFGAKGDGTSDDTAAFNAAIDAARGGTVVIPGPGVYSVRGVSVTAEGTRVVGVGEPTVRMQQLPAGDASPIFAVTVSRVSFVGIRVDGNKKVQAKDGFSDSWAGGKGGVGRAYRAGIRAFRDGHVLSGLNISRCRFENMYGAAIAARDVDGIVVKGNHFEDNNFESLFASTTYAHGGGQLRNGVTFEHNLTLRAQSGDAQVNANEGIIARYRNVSWSENRSDTTERGTKFEGCEQVMVSGNSIRNVLIGNFSALKFQFEGRDIQVVDNHIQNAGRGIDVLWAKGGLGFWNVTLARNVIRRTTGDEGDGIQIAGLSPRTGVIAIEGNQIEDSARYGIYVAYLTSLEGLSIRGNRIRSGGDGIRLVPLGRWDHLGFSGNDVDSRLGRALSIAVDVGRWREGSGRGMVEVAASAAAELRGRESMSAVFNERRRKGRALVPLDTPRVAFSADGVTGVRQIRLAIETPTVAESSDGVVVVNTPAAEGSYVLLPRVPEELRPYVLVDIRDDGKTGVVAEVPAVPGSKGEREGLIRLHPNGAMALQYYSGTWREVH